MNIFCLQNTPADKDYDGCGQGCLVIKNGIPQKLIYSPDRDVGFSESQTELREVGAADGVEVYLGAASCWKFIVEAKIFPLGGDSDAI